MKLDFFYPAKLCYQFLTKIWIVSLLVTFVECNANGSWIDKVWCRFPGKGASAARNQKIATYITIIPHISHFSLQSKFEVNFSPIFSMKCLYIINRQYNKYFPKKESTHGWNFSPHIFTTKKMTNVSFAFERTFGDVFRFLASVTLLVLPPSFNFEL